MKKYKVVLVRQKGSRSYHRTDWRDLHEEIHLVKARSTKMAVEEARSLVSWVNKELPSGERVELRAIYELRPNDSSCVIPIAIRF